MSQYPKHPDVVFIGTLTASEVQCGRRSVHASREHNQSFDNLLLLAAASRWRLGRLFLQEGQSLLSLPTPLFRLAVSRLYYSMYHSMRAVAFTHFRGDDNEGHSKLHTKEIPGFDQTIKWQSILKNARTERNQADYDPFPSDDTNFEGAARSMEQDAAAIQHASMTFLRSRGVAL